MKQALLIVNDRSGTADADLEPALDRLRDGGIEVRQFTPSEPAEIDDIIGQEAAKADLIVLGGGDGTMSGSAAALLASDRPLGILPMGTANDFARSLEIPSDLEQAAQIIAEGHTRVIDVGLMDARPFLNVASIGFSVEVARFHTGERKRRLRLLSYPVSWMDAYRRHRPFRARIVCDGSVMDRRCVQLAVGSGRHYGGGLTISEDARIDDGWLRVYYVEPLGVLGWLKLLPSFRFGTLDKHREAELLRAQTVEISTKGARPINLDGELIGRTPAGFSIRPKALTVFAPEPADANG